MKITVAQLKEVICEALKNNFEKAWREDFENDDFVPVWKHFPKVAYHATHEDNAKEMLKGFQPKGWDNNIDFAFLPDLAKAYGNFSHGEKSVLMKVDIRKLDKDHIYMNYDIGEDGFSYDGYVPKGAMKVVDP